MALISVKPQTTATAPAQLDPGQFRAEVTHPVRLRIMSLLADGRARTQRDLGRALFMSSAAVHYHLAALVRLGAVALSSTQPGPNGITEKLYKSHPDHWRELQHALDEADVRDYLDLTAAWMHERHREGLEILKAGEHDHPFLLGSYAVKAPRDEVLKLKARLWELVREFHDRHAHAPAGEARATCTVTFGILPSFAEECRETLNVLEYEPVTEPAAAAAFKATPRRSRCPATRKKT